MKQTCLLSTLITIQSTYGFAANFRNRAQCSAHKFLWSENIYVRSKYGILHCKFFKLIFTRATTTLCTSMCVAQSVTVTVSIVYLQYHCDPVAKRLIIEMSALISNQRNDFLHFIAAQITFH